MSTATTFPEQTLEQANDEALSVENPDQDFSVGDSNISSVVEAVQAKIAPVWPLKDYIATNPYAGFSGQKFLTAREELQRVSEHETLMGLDYFREQFSQNAFGQDELVEAIHELATDGVQGADNLDLNQILESLCESQASPVASTADNHAAGRIHSLPECLDHSSGTKWHRFVCEEISKHCAAHYDQGQAAWASPWKHLPLCPAWQAAAQIDRTPEILGLPGFRSFVAELPSEPLMVLDLLLDRLKIPQAFWENYLLCVALTLPGWCAWTVYQDREASRAGKTTSEFAGLLAIHLAYHVAIAEGCDFTMDWEKVDAQLKSGEATPNDDILIKLALLKADEVAFRKKLLSGLSVDDTSTDCEQTCKRPLAQMVFCIDVRSERIRRHLEAASTRIETFGFAGFFALPIQFVPLGETIGDSHVPALISPQFKVHEEVESADAATNAAVVERKSFGRFLRKAWKEFQTSSASCFSFVESTGLLYGVQLVARSMGWGSTLTNSINKLADGGHPKLAPTLRGLHHQGITTSKQVDLAESILRGIGIVGDFGRLFVFCGHASETDNNPLKAGLDCGACCGHSGEPNARLAARLLNQQSVRQSLSKRGIVIPDDTQFVAALHNTTTDTLEFFDTQNLPASHLEELQELEKMADNASQQTRLERLSQLPGPSSDDLFRRSHDWAEVRPEWGLAGNAAFIAAPRSLTDAASLEGRAFLHSYDFRIDPKFAVLEQIMTAPLIVAHWINMQYYASTVDPAHMGSGTKTVHNVVGQFGILSGNSGDLMTGLPWQSIHDGTTYRHHPLRLLAVIVAPRDAIESIINRHEALTNLLTNGWLHLVAIDDGANYRFTERGTWNQITLKRSAEALC